MNSDKKAVNKLKTTKDYKPLTDEQIKLLVDDVFEEVSDKELMEDLRMVLNPDVLEYSTEDRKVPDYVQGYLDKPFLQGGKPTREKDLALYNAILSEDYAIIEVEGSVRGAKDVNCLLGASRKAMVMPDPIVLALGSSLEHVLRTVLMAGGFGFYYTIPHGVFIRETIHGAQRGVYKFLDSYGFEKQILFYGNEKENDGNKYQGFSGIGLVYVNETLNQHINGLHQAQLRLGTSRSPLMLMTQNPRGQNSPFYIDFESHFRIEENTILEVERFRDKYRPAFEKLADKIKEQREKERKEKIDAYITARKKTAFRYLSDKEKIDLQKIMLDHNYDYSDIINNIPAQKFDPTIRQNDYLYNKSIKKIMGYFRGEKNINNVYNAYDFAYFHYTIDDNMALNEIRKNDFKNRYERGSATYEQNILGKRRSTEGAVYTGFGADNVFSDDLSEFDWSDKLRYIVIDPGFNHPTGITDWAVDVSKGMVWGVQERLIDFNKEYPDRKSFDVIYDEMLLLIRKLNNRNIDTILVDPSNPALIQYLRDRGWNVFPANNETFTPKNDEKTFSHTIERRELRGIPLIQTAFAKKKIFIHETCSLLISQIETYSYEKTKDGTDKLQSLNDDLVDTVKYLVNTVGISSAMWLIDEVGGDDYGENEQESIRRNEIKKDGGWNLGREINQAFQGLPGFESYGEEDDTSDDGFFGAFTDDFF